MQVCIVLCVSCIAAGNIAMLASAAEARAPQTGKKAREAKVNAGQIACREKEK